MGAMIGDASMRPPQWLTGPLLTAWRLKWLEPLTQCSGSQAGEPRGLSSSRCPWSQGPQRPSTGDPLPGQCDGSLAVQGTWQQP
eukprot:560495-Lingulodinium_polyedra.AAC.1